MPSTPTNSEKVSTPSLSNWFSKRIAAHDGVPVEEVTTEYIQRKRDQELYPVKKYEIGSKYGGYNTIELKFMTRNAILDLLRRIDAAFAKL